MPGRHADSGLRLTIVSRVARPLPAAERRSEVDALPHRGEASPLPALALGTFPRQVEHAAI